MTTVIAEYKSATDVRPTTPHAHTLTRLLSEFESLLHLIELRYRARDGAGPVAIRADLAC